MKTPEGIYPERLVVVSSVNGDRYVGHVPEMLISKTPESYMEQSVVQLLNVRTFISQVRMLEQRGGPGASVSSMVFIVPTDVSAGPFPEMMIRPAAWYFPAKFPEIRDKIFGLLDLCIKNEAANRARDAGIVLQ